MRPATRRTRISKDPDERRGPGTTNAPRLVPAETETGRIGVCVLGALLEEASSPASARFVQDPYADGNASPGHERTRRPAAADRWIGLRGPVVGAVPSCARRIGRIPLFDGSFDCGSCGEQGPHFEPGPPGGHAQRLLVGRVFHGHVEDGLADASCTDVRWEEHVLLGQEPGDPAQPMLRRGHERRLHPRDAEFARERSGDEGFVDEVQGSDDIEESVACLEGQSLRNLQVMGIEDTGGEQDLGRGPRGTDGAGHESRKSTMRARSAWCRIRAQSAMHGVGVEGVCASRVPSQDRTDPGVRGMG